MTSWTYQKGDLVTIKEKSLVFYHTPGSAGVQSSSRFHSIPYPINGVYLGALDKNDTAFPTPGAGSPFRKPCKIAVGNKIYVVESGSFFFHIQRD